MSIPAPTAPEATPLLPVQRALRSPDCRYRVAAYYGAPPGRWDLCKAGSNVVLVPCSCTGECSCVYQTYAACNIVSRFRL
jgi:hypothetical protein